ncbi:MAG: modulated sigma54 specific transcriptional regulator, Fis family, partial [Firmicutes bacterium]|nr:modulated sigma54 specific transcriptional regulator, Fis family [Bacillota bacterium]
METTSREHSNTNNVPAYPVGTDVHSQERWSGIMEYKRKFIQNQLDNLYSNPYMNAEVVDSWLRSRESGLDPFTETINGFIASDNLKDVLEENDLLIESTKILFAALKLKDLVIASRYALYLFDKNSILLLHEGDYLAPDNSMVGTVWSEESAGTCAHHLALRLKRPYHLLGPEHYCVIMDNSNSSAAPVLDDEGEAIGVLVLSQHLPNNAGDNAYLSLSSHTMGLITAMAAAVENRMKLKKSYEEVRAAHLRQKATLAFIDEGIVTLEKNGKIVHVNKEATRIFRRPAEELENNNIRQFLNKQSQLMLLVEQGENADIDENFMVDNEEQPYFVNIRSVLDPGFKNAGGAILRLNSAEKINALVTNRSGAKASYNFDNIIGQSDVFKKTIAMGKRFAKSTENVLIIGESGTGKELFAQSMHNEYRPNGPFIAVNCAAMPRNLIESELFGYEPGSFTGAERSGRPGKIELAHGGTLFLDEIGDMPL